ncbi:hypothetical protein B296_00019957 [Ensete ventricosum]|uniref:Uncharacterized protein n=1 Tax=Ensete ventricosum TaxID=4639 RepID=A0A427B1Q5_ENSVE|nr:hypothetical protein B296_00019957 [Ensete ventricosum]
MAEATTALGFMARGHAGGEHPGDASLKRAAWLIFEALRSRLASPKCLSEQHLKVPWTCLTKCLVEVFKPV